MFQKELSCPTCKCVFHNIAGLVAHWDQKNVDTFGNKKCLDENGMYNVGMYYKDNKWFYETVYSVKTHTFNTHKVCVQCDQKIPYRHFTRLKPKRKQIDDGYMRFCKSCMTERQKIAFAIRKQKRENRG